MSAMTPAQALLVGCAEGHAVRGEPLYLHGGPPDRDYTLIALADDHGPLYGVQHFVAVDETLPALVTASLPQVRWITFAACARRGWIADDGTDVFETQRLGTVWFSAVRDVHLRRIVATDAGLAALDAYRRRPPDPLPVLGEDEREVVELAVRAARLGYALVPATDDAKRAARQLARTPFARRGWGGGASTLSLEATATGEVEVEPGASG